MRSLKGYLPTPSFVMAKKSKILKAGASLEVPAFMFILERQEQGEALFTKMLEAMGLKRQDALISNLVDDQAALDAQIKSTQPKILITLGEKAAQTLLGKSVISELRGQIHEYQGIKLVATFHPAFMLKTQAAKKDCWEDLQSAMKEIGWKKP